MLYIFMEILLCCVNISGVILEINICLHTFGLLSYALYKSLGSLREGVLEEGLNKVFVSSLGCLGTHSVD